MKPKIKTKLEGWGRPVGAQVSHYFRNGVSLCSRWTWKVDASEPLTGSIFKVDKDDCRECATACRREAAS